MATTEDIRSLLQQQATQRINPFMRGLSILTGGLAGEFTGTNEDIRNRELAKRTLMEQNIKELEEEKAMRRQLLVNAVQQNIQLDPNAPIQEMMDKLRSEGVKGEVIKSQGRIFGLGQSVGPSPYEADPRYQVAALGGQRELAERRAEFEQQSNLERAKLGPNLVAQLGAYGVTASPDMPVGQLSAMLDQERARAQGRIYSEDRGKQARAGLAFLQQKGEIPMVEDLSKIPDEEAVVRFNILGREYEQKNREFQFERKAAAEDKAVDDFNLLLSNPNQDQEALKRAYLKLPKASRIEEYRIAAGVNRPATPKENESLDSYISSIGKASSLAKSMYELAGDGEISKVSKANFNGFKSWFRGLQNTYGVEDAKLRSINNVIQEFQTLIAEQRKDFFGASLTNNELETAKELFGDPNRANFLPRVIALVDSIMSKDEIQNKYERRGIFVNPATKKDVQDARKGWDEIKKQYNFVSLGQKGKIGQVVPAGGTNVMDTIKIDSIEEIP